MDILKLQKINPKPQTLESCWELIAALVQVVEIQQEQLKSQEELIHTQQVQLNSQEELLHTQQVQLKTQQEKILALEERLNVNSKNSSLSPSKDHKKKPKKDTAKKSTRKKRGPKKGHKGTTRKLVPQDKVDKFIECPAPKSCSDCGDEVYGLSKISRRQVYEIPLPSYEILEYQIKHGRCKGCGKRHSGTLPVSVAKSGFGPRLHGFLALFTTKYRLSKRQAKQMAQELYGVPMSLGSVSNIEARMSKALDSSYSQIKAEIDKTRVINIDETGFKQGHLSGWAWLMSSLKATYIELDRSRGKKVAKRLIGNFIGRIFISDRYSSYDFLPSRNHQVCWSHLKRDFQKISERAGKAGAIGRALLKCYGKSYAFWKSTQVHVERYNCKRTKRKRNRLKNSLMSTLARGAKCEHKQTARTCANILSQGGSLWLFLTDPEVEATNNHAERQLRPLVIAKKLSFGVQSQKGARFIERAYSVLLTCQQKQTSSLEWFIASFQSHYTENPYSMIF